ncbi:MAG: hypothetical protein IJS40_04850 [Synergistaceae bacterium]|nr:hypothetical protein [Synergistaceae bacterium]
MSRNKNTNDQERIDQLLTMAWDTTSTARILAIANQILEINPYNVDALVLKADNIEDQDRSIELLEIALNALNEPGNCEPDDKDLFFVSINQRLAFAYMSIGNLDKAFKFCEDAINFAEAHSDAQELHDETNNTLIKALYYRILIERREWQKILTASMRDGEGTLGRAYAKLLAAWFMAPEKSRGVCANLLWDALSIAPDVPFYMLGYFEEPDDNASEEAHEDFDFALLYYDTVSISEEFNRWFSRGVIMFGIFTGRFDEKEKDYLVDVLDSLGGYDEYEKMKSILVETEDSAVLEAFAANKCLTE